MLRGTLRAIRYARNWSGGSSVVRQDIEIDRDGLRVPASFVTPTFQREQLPGWIMLGGLTRMGRMHPQLVRFADAIAASGVAVIVPEIPEWQDLRLSPRVTMPTIQAAVRALDARPEVKRGKYALSGVSFGAPQAAIAASSPQLTDHIAEIVCFGGYCDLERTMRCQLTGLHEWKGVTRRVDPDPYGRWVLAANYLTGTPGYEDAGDVAEGLRSLAMMSTGQRIPAWDARIDPLKVQVRASLPVQRHALFDLFAPLSTEPLPGGEAGERMARELTDACRRAEPLLDPSPELGRMRVPIHLFHGRGDRLVPFTESLRFREGLPDSLPAHVTVTGLLAHSAETKPQALPERAREIAIFFRGISRVLGAIG
jgi:pimeloyl-ACP methyl ester carboxylesterase